VDAFRGPNANTPANRGPGVLVNGAAISERPQELPPAPLPAPLERPAQAVEPGRPRRRVTVAGAQEEAQARAIANDPFFGVSNERFGQLQEAGPPDPNKAPQARKEDREEILQARKVFQSEVNRDPSGPAALQLAYKTGGIEAVLNPTPGSRELFFVAKGDGTHIFSESGEQHAEAVARVRAQRAVSDTAGVSPGVPDSAGAGAPAASRTEHH
jgi:hypothetical protein